MAAFLEREGVALDAAHYRDAPPGLRLWCGATVEREDVARVLPWLDAAYAEALRG
jgi:phosphoserine aminotransferase